LIGGGLFVLLGNPEASPEALAKKAVLTLKLAGCHEPEKATIVGTAIGDSGGRRTSMFFRSRSASGSWSTGRRPSATPNA
jgi:hypothetical protein